MYLFLKPKSIVFSFKQIIGEAHLSAENKDFAIMQDGGKLSDHSMICVPFSIGP